MEQSDEPKRRMTFINHKAWFNREARAIAKQRGCSHAEGARALNQQIAENKRRLAEERE